jgi:hypothetical protein
VRLVDLVATGLLASCAGGALGAGGAWLIFNQRISDLSLHVQMVDNRAIAFTKLNAKFGPEQTHKCLTLIQLARMNYRERNWDLLEAVKKDISTSDCQEFLSADSGN